MTYIVSSGALNSTPTTTDSAEKVEFCGPQYGSYLQMLGAVSWYGEM